MDFQVRLIVCGTWSFLRLSTLMLLWIHIPRTGMMVSSEKMVRETCLIFLFLWLYLKEKCDNLFLNHRI